MSQTPVFYTKFDCLEVLCVAVGDEAEVYITDIIDGTIMLDNLETISRLVVILETFFQHHYPEAWQSIRERILETARLYQSGEHRGQKIHPTVNPLDPGRPS